MLNNLKSWSLRGLVSLVLVLSSCGGLTKSGQPATTTWLLTPYQAQSQSVSSDVVRQIELTVIAVPGLDSNQIQTLSPDAELNHYAGALWADHLPELVTSLVGRTLQTSGRFRLSTDHVSADLEACTLSLEVQEFFAGLDESGQSSRVHVQIRGQYRCDTGQIIEIDLNSVVPIEANTMNAIVAAFQRAVDQVMQDLLKQL